MNVRETMKSTWSAIFAGISAGCSKRVFFLPFFADWSDWLGSSDLSDCLTGSLAAWGNLNISAKSTKNRCNRVSPPCSPKGTILTADDGTVLKYWSVGKAWLVAPQGTESKLLLKSWYSRKRQKQWRTSTLRCFGVISYFRRRFDCQVLAVSEPKV